MEKITNSKIRTFTQLHAWKEGHRLVLMVYKVAKSFPATEQFGLTSQIQRAAVSITSNIAEGFSRNSQKEKVQFYYMALGSLTEMQNQLLIARDLDYLSSDNFSSLAAQSITVNKLLNGLIKSIKNTSLTT
jgi:four helix bundle protein